MVNENLISLIENKKPVELVQELKDYEIKKSPLSAAARNKVVRKYGGNYQSPRIDSRDIALMQMYGPGFWEGVWDVTKKVGGVALAVSYATPIAPFTMTGTLVVASSAMAMDKYGNDTDKKIAREIKDVLVVAHEADGINGAASEVGNTIGNYKGWKR